MHTQCPHCQTIFSVTAAHLNIAQGHVRCSHCRNIFNASNHLLKQVPNQTTPKQLQVDEKPTTTYQEDDVPELLQEDIYEPPRGRSWKSFFFLSFIVILLAATLAVQVIWFWQPDRILQDPQIRPWLDRFCYTLLCTLPTTRDLESFYMQNNIARVHPEVDKAIQFEATFVNSAFFPQPYPELQLTFEDFNGNPLAQRRFKPAKYLPQPPGKNQQMRPNASVHIKLDLADMDKVIEGDNIAAGYHFEFF